MCSSPWLKFKLRSFHGSTSGFVLRLRALDHWKFANTPGVDLHVAVGVLSGGYLCKGETVPSYKYRVHEQSHYVKGQVLWDRHRWRLWLMRNYGVRLTRQLPVFPLYFLKSVWELMTHKA